MVLGRSIVASGGCVAGVVGAGVINFRVKLTEPLEQ